ncbi:MAG TPA: HU family DNA-binding protein [Acidimicrobiales bacterium]|nr:HU family DNA-binding protein [Acidimicrobiales bacterium]
MTKAELIDKVAAEAGVEKREAEAVLSAAFQAVVDGVKAGDKVAWPGFGTFSVSQRAARKGRNPQTGAEISIPASRALRFSQASAVKEALSN